MLFIDTDAILIADRTKDAYSYSAFGREEWLATAQALLNRGYTAEQVEAILRSKITRWARDAYADDNEGKAIYVLQYLDKEPNATKDLFDRPIVTSRVVTLRLTVTMNVHAASDEFARNGAISRVTAELDRAYGFLGVEVHDD